MRCERCGKNFDEEMYSGICPKCGHFNNRQKEYDVSGYFSAKFDDGGKVSTSPQAAKQHAQLHKMYDKSDVHKRGSLHAELHKTYDENNAHKYEAQQAKPYQAERINPYQQTTAQGNIYQTQKPNPYQQGNTYRSGAMGAYRQGNTRATGKPGYSYPKAGYSKREQYRQAKLNGEVEKNLVTPICIAIAVLAVIITAAACYIKQISLTGTYSTLDYEQEFAEAGEIFEINNRMLIVEKAEVVDTSMLDDVPAHIPVEDKLVAVTVELLPTDERNRSKSRATGLVYLSDGYRCRENLDRYTLGDLLIKEYSEEGEPIYYVTDDIVEEFYSMNEYNEEEVLTKYDYLNYYYYASEGKTGKYYFLASKDADEVTISFDLGREKSGISILEKRVSVPLVLEEEVP